MVTVTVIFMATVPPLSWPFPFDNLYDFTLSMMPAVRGSV